MTNCQDEYHDGVTPWELRKQIPIKSEYKYCRARVKKASNIIIIEQDLEISGD